MADGAGVQVGFRMGAIDGPATPPMAASFFPIIAADMVAAIGGNERGQESGTRSAAGPRPRFGDDVEAGSKGTPKKEGPAPTPTWRGLAQGYAGGRESR